MRRRAASGEMSDVQSVLAIPEGWILDPVSRERLQRQLARASSTCTAVVAEWGELPPGASHLVCSERRALTPESQLQPVTDLSIRGAALVRPDVGFEVGDNFVKLERGALLVDMGTMVHDPWQPVGMLEDASPVGRPLTKRPVALFLGFEADPFLADWVRALVNGLVRRGVEGRIAVPGPTGGLHLTKPCAPTEASVRTLAPGVIVALDDTAVERSTTWLGRRAHGLVRLMPDTTAAIAAESARIGWLRRRVEARIGRGIDPDSMAELVQRLAPTRDT